MAAPPKDAFFTHHVVKIFHRKKAVYVYKKRERDFKDVLLKKYSSIKSNGTKATKRKGNIPFGNQPKENNIPLKKASNNS
jgi:hypothetical protein